MINDDILIYKAEKDECGGYEIHCPVYMIHDELWMDVGFAVELNRFDVYDGRYDNGTSSGA